MEDEAEQTRRCLHESQGSHGWRRILLSEMNGPTYYKGWALWNGGLMVAAILQQISDRKGMLKRSVSHEALELATWPRKSVQCGIQVNLQPEEEDESEDSPTKPAQGAKRKQKKKEYKRRKREKQQQTQKQAKAEIGSIIQEFYDLSSTFAEHSEKLQQLVKLVYNSQFRDFLDGLIRLHVKSVQKEIWEHTRLIFYGNPTDKAEDTQFYSEMVDEIYRHFEELGQASQQIEQIINIYLKHAYANTPDSEGIIYNNLALNTFNYMVDSDQTLFNLIRMCFKKADSFPEEQRRKIVFIADMIPDDDYDDSFDDSTGVSSEEEVFEDKKRKKVKITDHDIRMDEQAIQFRLRELCIKDEIRVPCRISQEWLGRFSKRKYNEL